MKNRKVFFSLMLIFVLSFVGFVSDDLDTGYAKTFGWGSICVSHSGYPSWGKFDESQFDFRDGKFYVNAGGTINLRAICPKGKTYGDLLKQYNQKHPEFSKKTEELIYWKIYSNYTFAGHKLFDKWPSNPEEMLRQNEPLCYMKFSAETGVKDWNSSGVDFNDNSNDMKTDVGNWLNNAKPGWQLYILHTVGFRRNCPENKFWDYSQGKEVVPIAFEMDKPFAYTIVEVK